MSVIANLTIDATRTHQYYKFESSYTHQKKANRFDITSAKAGNRFGTTMQQASSQQVEHSPRVAATWGVLI